MDQGLVVRYAHRMEHAVPLDVASAALDARLKVLLPETYQGIYQELTPAPMRSAAFQYDADGRVAWDRMWGSFCDLAMAGGRASPELGRRWRGVTHARHARTISAHILTWHLP